jgi:hypothetical protein
VDERVLDSLLCVHSYAGNIDLMEGSVIPLYDHYGFPLTSRSFKHIIQCYLKMHQYPKIIRIWEELGREVANLDRDTLNPLLEAFTNIRDQPKIAELLKIFINNGQEPSKGNLERLGSAGNLPDTLRVLLNNF